MTYETALEAQRIFPTFRYRDAPAMIDWLETAFGFVTHARYMDGDTVAHAQMAFGGSMIMLGSAQDDDFGKLVGAPGPQGGASTYIACEDPDALFARAKAAGATMLSGLVDQDYGSRDFLCADPEGNVWCFGTYWPKAQDASD